MCVLGKRLLKDINIENCTKDIDGILWNEFCVLQNNSRDRDFLRNPDVYRMKTENWNCDTYFAGKSLLITESLLIKKINNVNFVYVGNNISTVQGIKGLSSGVFFDNLMPSFLDVSETCSISNHNSFKIRFFPSSCSI